MKPMHALLATLLLPGFGCSDGNDGSNMGPDISGPPASTTPDARQNSFAWARVPTGGPISGLHGSSADNVWAVNNNYYGFYWRWDGTSLTESMMPNIGSVENSRRLGGVWTAGPNDTWVVGQSDYGPAGTIWHWDGAMWSVVYRDFSRNFRGVWGSGPNDVWIVGGTVQDSPTDKTRGGVIEHWDGKTLTEIPTLGKEILYAVHGTGPEDVWMVGANAVDKNLPELSRTVLHYDGTTVLPVTPPAQEGGSPQEFYAVFALSRGDVLIGGTGLYRLSGSSWIRQGDAYGSVYCAISGKSANDIWAVSGTPLPLYLNSSPPNTGALVHFDGTAWHGPGVQPFNGSLRNIWGAPADDLWLGGGDLWRGSVKP